MSRLKAFGRGAQESTSFGFTDEMRGFGRAIGSKIRGDDRKLSELVSLGINEVRDEYTQAKQDRPGATLSGEITGAIAPIFTPGGQAVAARIGSGNLGARIAKGAGAGALSAGAYGFGTGEGDVAERLPRAGKYAAGGAVLGGGLPAAAAGLGKLNTKTIIPASDEIRAAGSKAFQLAEQKGGALSAGESNKFYNRILAIRPQTMEGAVFKGESPVSKILDNVATLKNRPMTLKAAMEIDEALGDLAYSTMDNFGKITSEGKKFLDMQGHLRRVIDEADERMVHGGKEGFRALQDARKYWSTSLRLREIERIIEKAKGREQPVTALKNGFNALLNRGDKLKGYSVAEVKAIRKAAQTGVVTDVLKLAGSGLVPIGSGVTGLAGGPVGGAIGFATGTAVQQGAKAIGVAKQMGRANNAAKAVAQKSGMVRTEPRVQIPDMREILNLPPKLAKQLLARK